MPVSTARKKTNNKNVKTGLYPDNVNPNNLIYFNKEEFSMIERLIRVEEEIKSINKNIELLVHQMDKRFEQIDKRFEQMDKRFEDMRHYMDKRFEQIDKRFTQMFAFMSIIFTVLGVLMTVYKFID